MKNRYALPSTNKTIVCCLNRDWRTRKRYSIQHTSRQTGQRELTISRRMLNFIFTLRVEIQCHHALLPHRRSSPPPPFCTDQNATILRESLLDRNTKWNNWTCQVRNSSSVCRNCTSDYSNTIFLIIKNAIVYVNKRAGKRAKSNSLVLFIFSFFFSATQAYPNHSC